MALVFAKGEENEEFVTYHSRRLVEMTTDIIQSYLLLRDAKHDERKMKIAEIFIHKMFPCVEMKMNYILQGKSSVLNNYQSIIG